MQAPDWLPEPVRRRWDDRRVSRAVAKVARTAPRRVADPGDAAIEVHMLVCRRDLDLSLVAAKSLLRFEGPPIAFTFTDDGSLTARDREYISAHLPGAHWLPTRVDGAGDGVDQTLGGRPHLAELYRSEYPCAPKALHPASLSKAPKCLVMDPDTAFFRRPDRIFDWAGDPHASALYLHDDRDEETAVPASVREAFGSLREAVGGRPWTLRHFFFNSGLLGFAPDAVDFGLAEHYLAWRDGLPESLRRGEGAIWFGDWTPEQTCYMVMFGFMDPPAEPLGAEYRIGFHPDRTFCHFLRHHLVRPATLEALGRLIDEL